MKYRVYCLYASLKGEEPAPWLIAAEDEYAYEGDPCRCDAVFQKAKDDAERNGWDVREVILLADIRAVYKAFEATEVPATVDDVRAERAN